MMHKHLESLGKEERLHGDASRSHDLFDEVIKSNNTNTKNGVEEKTLSLQIRKEFDDLESTSSIDAQEMSLMSVSDSFFPSTFDGNKSQENPATIVKHTTSGKQTGDVSNHNKQPEEVPRITEETEMWGMFSPKTFYIK